MEIKITTSNGVKLRTAGKYVLDDVHVVAQAYDGAVGEGAVNEIDALLNGNITEITSYVTTLIDYAFAYSKSLTSITLPNVIILSSFALNNCNKLKNVEIPNVTTIKRYSLGACGIASLNLPNVETIEEYAFAWCGNLKNIYLGYDGIVALEATTAFTSVSNCIIHVKSQYAEQYTNATNWASLITEGKVVVVGDYNAS